MPYYSVARMVEASKKFGLPVEVVPGAESRGSASFNPFGFVGHHTAGPKTGDRPSLNICVNGRPDLDGPLCNDFLTRAGVNVIVAAGRANHAGAGGFRGLVGNSAVWGCEAEDDGDGTWTAAQLAAYPRLVAARLWLIDRDASWYCAHRTWAPTRKIDPTGIEDTWMRSRVAPLLASGGGDPVPALDATDLKNIRAQVDASVKTQVDHATYILMYGDNANDGTDKNTHPNNLQMLRALLMQLAKDSAAREGALLGAVQALAGQVAGGVDYARLTEIIDAAAAQAVEGIDVVFNPHAPAPPA